MYYLSMCIFAAGIQVLQSAEHLQSDIKPLDSGSDGQLSQWHSRSWC